MGAVQQRRACPPVRDVHIGSAAACGRRMSAGQAAAGAVHVQHPALHPAGWAWPPCSMPECIQIFYRAG